MLPADASPSEETKRKPPSRQLRVFQSAPHERATLPALTITAAGTVSGESAGKTRVTKSMPAAILPNV